MSDLPAGLTFRTFRAADEPDLMAELMPGWYDAQASGFHQGRTTEEHRRTFGHHLVVDDAIVRGVWADHPVLADRAVPVATYASYDKTLHTGRTLQPARMVSDVTVSPTHRRRGLLRALITADLQDAADRGVPLAVLTASEGSIYQRFGFGPAVFQHTLRVDTGPRFALRPYADAGSVELVEPGGSWPTLNGLFQRFHERTRGTVAQPDFYRAELTGEYDFDSGGPGRDLRIAVHLDADGTPDGYTAYKSGPRKDGVRTLRVTDLVTLSTAAHLRLWQFLADVDLSDIVEWDRAAVDEPLPWALVDPFVARVTRHADALWVRVLDVPEALAARPWGHDGDVVLEVDDPLGHAAGRYEVVVRDGLAEVSRTEDDADVRLTADTLGSLHLGGVQVGTLRRAGRLTGREAALESFAAMADTGPAPHNPTGF